MWIYYSGNDGSSFRVCLATAPITNMTTMTVGSFTKHPNSPLMTGHTEPDVVKDGSNWYMAYREESSGKPGIGIMSSSNGLNWSEHGEKISPSSSGFDSAELVAPSLIKEGSTWYCFYETDNEDNIGDRRIGYATASSPTGTWTKQGQALDASGGWESNIVGTPAVCKIDGKFYLFYHGYASGKDQIGVAYSNSLNGPWSKESSNPILVVGADDDNPPQPTGEWMFNTDGPDQVRIFKTTDADDSIGGCTMNFTEAADRGHGYRADDPRDIELSYLIKFQNAGNSGHFIIEGPTGKDGPVGCCQDFSYKLDLDFQSDPPQWKFRKEMVNGSTFDDPITGTWTTSLAPNPLLGTGKFYGIGYVHYIKPNGANSGHNTTSSVVLEAWFNPDPAVDMTDWTMIKRAEDKGNWGNNGTTCSGDADQIGVWSNSQFKLVSTVTNGEFILKNLSLREINPAGSFGDNPEDPEDPPGDSNTLQGQFTFKWDVNTTGVSSCAGAVEAEVVEAEVVQPSSMKLLA